MERKKQKTSRPYVKKPLDRKKEYFHAIGIADRGTGLDGGYYFSMLNLKEICVSSSMMGPSFYASPTTNSLSFAFEHKPPTTSLLTSILVTLTCTLHMPNDVAPCAFPYKPLAMRLIPFSIVPTPLHSPNPQSIASCFTFDNSTSGHGQLTQTPKK